MKTTVRLLLGDQLNSQHSWFQTTDPDVVYVMMEIRQETDYVLHHAQKILAIFAAMRHFARALSHRGHRVHYLTIDDPGNTHSLTHNLTRVMQQYEAGRLEWQEPDEYRLDQQLAAFAATLPEACCVSSEHFITSRHFAAGLFKTRKSWLMEHFYRQLRKQENVLMRADGSPEGERWNFDHDNRKRWSGSPAAPADWRLPHDHSKLWETIVLAGVRSFGNPQAHALRWPVSRAEALSDLDNFIENALPWFGDYQDAMAHGQVRLFHSLLSFALNVKLLNPRELIAKVEQAWRDGKVSLAGAEGFIRQILGWREYVRGVYWARMPDYVTVNELNHGKPLPDWFWTGKTDMHCLSDAIGQSLEHAYAHHIQRLMIIGNYALLAGLDPQAVHTWYLGVYIDAFEWVEAPNTLGMSQFADGGLLATKPYVSSAAYVDRMSDYCRNCPYDRKARTGARACPFNALYWAFFDRHRTRLERNPRLGMVYRQLNAMTQEQIAALREQANRQA
ncbi:MAG: cryptochrome/photolyase family protein [Alcaligenaceae bacterium]|nr:cryptochrome/photolyase family protein [Alcaligenaceae bacterium]